MNPVKTSYIAYNDQNLQSAPPYLHQKIRPEAYDYAMPRKMVKKLTGYDVTFQYFSSPQGDMRERTIETPRYEYDLLPGTEMEEALRKCATIHEMIGYAIQFRSDDSRREQAFIYIINVMRGMGIHSFTSLTTYLRSLNPPVLLKDPQNFPLPEAEPSQNHDRSRNQCSVM